MFGFYDGPAGLYGDPADDPGMGTFDSLALGGLTPMPRQAAPLRQPPPKRLTTEELAAFLDKAGAEPSRPAPLTGIGQLSGEDLKQARLGSLWAGLSALGTGISGHWDRAAAQGLPAIQEAQDRAVAGANARQQAGYDTSLADFKSKQADQQQKAVVGGLMGFYNQIAEAEPDGSPFVARAEQAARSGDMASLEKMAQQEPYRTYARSHGADPDAWGTQQQLQAQLQDLLKKQSLTTLSGPEAQAAALKAKAEQDARLPGEMKLKMAPSYQAPPQYEPLERVAAKEEMLQKIRDAHEAVRTQKSGQQGTIGVDKGTGLWYFYAKPDAAHPQGQAVKIDGQPENVGGLVRFTKEGAPYVMNPKAPELGAVAVKVYEEGEKGAPDIPTLKAGKKIPSPPPVDSPDAALAATLHRLNARPGGTPTPQPAAPPVKPPPAPATPEARLQAAAAAHNFDLARARRDGHSEADIRKFLGLN